MMEGPGIRAVDNETKAQVSRRSKEGKLLTYKINVIQHPKAARACGSGAKSSADRRPVDPPPIVELKIYEGESGSEGELTDVTFSMNGNYILFATLEHARHHAHGRHMTQEQRSPPVLTGTPVAGMVYLERPSPAGYFVFPDLSVRHEGKYRIAWSLFEEVKDQKDEDRIDQGPKPPGCPHGYISHRLEVRSVPFNVYSAKRFPGLAESTSLSRDMADQGCRVRIRRDVRMRRRETKPGKDWGNAEDDVKSLRGRMSATPESYLGHGYMDQMPRQRSSSNASHHSLMSAGPSRKPSLPDMTQVYQQQPPPYAATPPLPQSAYPQPAGYAAPSSQYAQQAPMPQQGPTQAPPPVYYQPTYAQQAALPPARGSQQYYGHPAPPAQLPPPAQMAPAPPYDGPQSHRISVDYSTPVHMDARRPYTQSASSSSAAPPAPRVSSSYNPAPAYQSGYPSQHAYHTSIGSLDGSNKPEAIHPPTRTTGAHTPLSSRPFNSSFDLPPLHSSYKVSGDKPPAPVSLASTLPPPTSTSYSTSSHYPAPTDTHKRCYGKVFNDKHQSQPLRQGARPGQTTQTPQPTQPSSWNSPNGVANLQSDLDLDDVEYDNEAYGVGIAMTYKRADGRVYNRHLPMALAE